MDQDGRPVPRAYVRVARSGRESSGVFADDRGRFELTAPSATCCIVASLAGFEPGEASCGAEPLRLEFKVGPIPESVLLVSVAFEPSPVGALKQRAFNSNASSQRRHHASYQADIQVAPSASYGDHRLTLMADWDGERATQVDTLLDSEIVETTSPGNVLFAPGQWAFRRPKHSGSVGATIDWRRLTTDVNGTFIGRFVDSDFGLFNPPPTENPGHSSWETRVSVALTRQISAILSIDNLTNADYSEPFGDQPLGRVVRAGARLAF